MTDFLIQTGLTLIICPFTHILNFRALTVQRKLKVSLYCCKGNACLSTKQSIFSRLLDNSTGKNKSDVCLFLC